MVGLFFRTSRRKRICFSLTPREEIWNFTQDSPSIPWCTHDSQNKFQMTYPITAANGSMRCGSFSSLKRKARSENTEQKNNNNSSSKNCSVVVEMLLWVMSCWCRRPTITHIWHHPVWHIHVLSTLTAYEFFPHCQPAFFQGEQNCIHLGKC